MLSRREPPSDGFSAIQGWPIGALVSLLAEADALKFIEPEMPSKVAAGICSTNPFWASNVKTPVNVKVPVRPLSVCAEPSETGAAEMLGA